MVSTRDAQAYQRFGARLRALRLERKLTQREVAEAVGLAPATYNQWERAVVAVPLAEAGRLAKFFECPLAELTDEREA